MQQFFLKKSGFTLVEIIIVIVIIGILVSLGNYTGILSFRERARVEEVTVELLGLIDEAKTDALLGKTDGSDHDIVRKSGIKIDTSTSNEIQFFEGVNLAKDGE